MDKPWVAKKALVISGLVRIRQKPINGHESLRYDEYGPSLIFKKIQRKPNKRTEKIRTKQNKNTVTQCVR